jgi:hypothetical protein
MQKRRSVFRTTPDDGVRKTVFCSNRISERSMVPIIGNPNAGLCLGLDFAVMYYFIQ